MEGKDWEYMQDMMVSQGMLAERLDYREAYMMDFLEKAYGG